MSPNLNYDFVEPQFKDAFFEWIAYKKQMKKAYKTQRGIENCYKELKEFSNNNPSIALQIVNRSIDKEWQGLFPLKTNRYESVANRQESGLTAALESLKGDLYTVAAGGSLARTT